MNRLGLPENSYVATFIKYLRGEEKARIYSEILRKSDPSDEEIEVMFQLSNDPQIQEILDAAFARG